MTVSFPGISIDEPPVDAMVEFVERLLERMTLQEKVGQMTQVTLGTLASATSAEGGAPPLDAVKVQNAIVKGGVGSVLNVHDRAMRPAVWRALIGDLQQCATLETRLGIPLLYGIDAIHGAGYTAGSTLFPQQLAIGASWNPENARAMARETARQIIDCGIPWNFSPVLDVARTPLWSRFFETFGEDVLLVEQMGLASVAGLGEVAGVAGCAKHFLAYSAPATGRDRTTAWMPEHELRERYLPPFRAAIEAGVESVMVNSGDVNGTPVHASHPLLTRLLRDEMGFQGVVVTDWEDVAKLHTVHRVADSPEAAVRMAVEAGIDMSMTPYDLDFPAHLTRLVERGEISEERIDASVRRILRMKFKLGLFEEPVPGAKRLAVPSEARSASRQAADESLVLLQNRGDVLPIGSSSRIALIGGAAELPSALLGPWSRTWQGVEEDAIEPEMPSVCTAFEAHFGDRLVPPDQNPDLVVVCVGNSPAVEKPGDIDSLELDSSCVDALERALGYNKPTVLVLMDDRPRLLGGFADQADAVIWAGRPGPYGGEALARVLDGTVAPSGRLPFTYPRVAAELVPYDHRYSDQLGSRYGLVRPFAFDGVHPRWKLGSGLSYSDVQYSGLTVTPNSCATEETATVSVTVANKGTRALDHVVLVFVSDLFASVSPSAERIRAFTRLHLEPGQSQRIDICLKVGSLGFEAPGEWRLEAGDFRVNVGSESAILKLVDSKKRSQSSLEM